MKHYVKEATRSLFRRIGLEVRRTSQPIRDLSDINVRRKLLLETNKINHLLDVGANQGQYASMMRNCGFSGRITSFEPLPKTFDALKATSSEDPLWSTHNIALGDIAGSAEFNVSGNTASSSFLSMSARHRSIFPESEYVDRVMIPIVRMDSLKKEVIQPQDRVYCKLDVQGYEMNVLRGARECMLQMQLIEVELCLTALYGGQPLPGEVIAFVNGAGYDLVSLDNGAIESSSGHVLWVDAIFQRRPA